MILFPLNLVRLATGQCLESGRRSSSGRRHRPTMSHVNAKTSIQSQATQQLWGMRSNLLDKLPFTVTYPTLSHPMHAYPRGVRMVTVEKCPASNATDMGDTHSCRPLPNKIQTACENESSRFLTYLSDMSSVP